MLFLYLIQMLSGFLMIKKGDVNMVKIRITGSEEQVCLFQDYLKRFNMTECTYISTPYAQNRKVAYSNCKNVAVYMNFKDYVSDEK